MCSKEFQYVKQLPSYVGYICRVGRDGECVGRTHLWDGEDSVCRMFSTGGLRQDKMEYFLNAPTEICLCCKRHPNYAGHESVDYNEDGRDNEESELRW